MTQPKIRIGSLIEGPRHRPLEVKYLIPACTWELRRLDPDHKLVKEAIDFIVKWGNDIPIAEWRKGIGVILSEDAKETYRLLDELKDALNALCPPFVYFDRANDDLSKYGFWFKTAIFHQAVRDYGTRKGDYVHFEGYGLWSCRSGRGDISLFEDDNGKLGRELYTVDVLNTLR